MKIKIISALLLSMFISPAFSSQDINFTPDKIDSGRSLLNSSIVNKYEPKLFKPTRLIIGQENIIKIKAKPGSNVLLATSFNNTGSSLLMGKEIRLGDDFRTIEGVVPENGILELSINLSNDKQLIDKTLYVEAAIWQAEDYSDLKIAKILGSNYQESLNNGITIKAPPIDASIPTIAPGIAGFTPDMMKTMDTLGKINNGDTESLNKLYDIQFTQKTPVLIRNMNSVDMQKIKQ